MKWTGPIGFVLLVGWFLSRPSTGGGEIYLLHARTLLGGAAPGQTVPEFPGSSVWIASLIAAIEWIAVQVGSPREIALSSALDQIEPAVRSWLPLVWSILAATLVFLGAALATRIARWAASAEARPAGGDRAESFAHEREFGGRVLLSAGGMLLPALVLVLLALSPAVGRSVSTLSPVLPGALILLWLTVRLLALFEFRRLVERPESSLASGIRDGLPVGVLLAWAPFAWPAALLYLGALAMARVPGTRIVATVAIAIGAGFLLDPSRLSDLGGAIEKIGNEWAREGGWPLLWNAFGSASFGALSIGTPAFLLVLLFASITCVLLFRNGRREIALWILGLWILFRLVPELAGVRTPGAIQAVGEPLWILTAAVAAAILPVRAARPVWLYRAGAVALLLGLTLTGSVREWQNAAPFPMLGDAIVMSLRERLGAEDLCLAERALPGGESLPGVFVLPRDSRALARYDFVYWSRWYAGFRYVLISETQVRQNLERAAPIAGHFYQRLATDGRLVAEFGDPVGYRLFELSPASAWRAPLTREELAAVQPAPELGSFLSQLGSVYAERGNRGLARILFEAGVRLDPDSDALANNLGSIYLLEREWEEAGRIFQKALDRSPDSPEILYNFARALFELNVQVRAEMMYRRAIALRPDFAVAHYDLARCFLAQDKSLLAAAALRRYLELAPQSPRRAEVEGVLATLASKGVGALPSGSGVDRVEPGME